MRLEEVFWEYLEELAKLEHRQLGPLIGRLASSYESGNLTAYLRGLCMLDSLGRLAKLQPSSATAAKQGKARQSDVMSLFHLTPCPGLLLSAQATILDCNRPALDWLDRDRRSLLGADLGSLLRLQMGQSFARYWDGWVNGDSALSVRQALVLLPGRLTATEISFVRLARNLQRPPSFLVWFAAPKAAARAPALKG